MRLDGGEEDITLESAQHQAPEIYQTATVAGGWTGERRQKTTTPSDTYCYGNTWPQRLHTDGQ